MNMFEMELPEHIRQALDVLEGSGHTGWLVGGCVRDAVMGVTPHDYDITTSALPGETIAAFKGWHVIETGLRHGTVTVVIGGEPVEITTFRVESEYLDNRHPSKVSFTRRVEDDLGRRDFTMNAMAWHPERGLLDPYGGREDIARRVIACVGRAEERFGEDGLRIMRALRFASRLGFGLSGETAAAVKKCRGLLSGISAERLLSELCGLLKGDSAWKIVLDYADVLAVFIPELSEIIGFEQNNRYHCYDVLEHTCRAIKNSPPVLEVRLALLLHDIGKPSVAFLGDDGFTHYHGHERRGAEMANEILLRLKASTRLRERVVQLVDMHDITLNPDRRCARRLLSRMSFEDACLLLDVKTGDRMAHAEGHRDISTINTMRSLLTELNGQEQCLAVRDLAIDGRRLMELGVPHGRMIGRILERLLDMVINEEIPNRSGELVQTALRLMDEFKE